MSIKKERKDSFIGRRLRKRYVIKKEIARGGMGRVYLARDSHDRDEVAIKYIPYGRPAPKGRPLFEASVLIRLDHANLPKVRDVFRDEKGHYLVMEYISGDTLTDLVRKKGPLSPERAARYVMSVLAVLSYLHGQKPPIIHRDIKPANLKFNGNRQLILVDFGIAKKFKPNEKTRYEVRGARTRGYAPPEQSLIGRPEAYSKSRTDARTDIFAVGGLLYYLLTGKHPPPVETQLETRPYHVDPRSENSAVPDPLAQVVITATRMNKEYRYNSAQEMEYALKQALLLSTGAHQVIGEVLEGVAPDVQTAHTSPNRSNRMFTILFILLLLVVVAVVAYLLLSG